MEESLKETKNKRILITTGIYPPKIGGPAQYAKNLKESFERKSFDVSVKTYTIEERLPTGIRHILFFLKIIPKLIFSDVIFALDTYSVGFPSVFAGKLFSKRVIIRTGGDFLWEGYVERTKKKVLFSKFYNTEISNFSIKEKVIFFVTRWTLRNASNIIFSTQWQRDIFIKAYSLDINKTSIVENYYGSKQADENATTKEFVGSTRKLVWKNLDLLKEVFSGIEKEDKEVKLFLDNLSFDKLMERIKKSYAVILVSIGDISPNMILDAIRYNRPFICTREVGIYERIKDAGIFVDPLNENEIKKAVEEILTEEGYAEAKERIRKFNFIHTWDDIADEFLKVANM